MHIQNFQKIKNKIRNTEMNQLKTQIVRNQIILRNPTLNNIWLPIHNEIAMQIKIPIWVEIKRKEDNEI
jgi:hypothetical protein